MTYGACAFLLYKLIFGKSLDRGLGYRVIMTSRKLSFAKKKR